ncbi:MAG: hypothetical protein MZV65_44315 [Chromatiales bacterium]|nr:hypothetical protein [Chromatiales bacterium]
MLSRFVESREDFSTPASHPRRNRPAYETAGYLHILLLSHHFGNRRIGRAAERHSPHSRLTFLDEAAKRFPDVHLYPLRRDVFAATRLRKRDLQESAFEVLRYEAHQNMYQDGATEILRSLLPVYTFATLHVVDEAGKPQSGFCTYFFDAEHRLSDFNAAGSDARQHPGHRRGRGDAATRSSACCAPFTSWRARSHRRKTGRCCPYSTPSPGPRRTERPLPASWRWYHVAAGAPSCYRFRRCWRMSHGCCTKRTWTMSELPFQKQAEFWGQAYEVLVKRGVLACLIEQGLVDAEHPQLAPWKPASTARRDESTEPLPGPHRRNPPRPRQGRRGASGPDGLRRRLHRHTGIPDPSSNGPEAVAATGAVVPATASRRHTGTGRASASGS